MYTSNSLRQLGKGYGILALPSVRICFRCKLTLTEVYHWYACSIDLQMMNCRPMFIECVPFSKWLVCFEHITLYKTQLLACSQSSGIDLVSVLVIQLVYASTYSSVRIAINPSYKLPNYLVPCTKHKG